MKKIYTPSFLNDSFQRKCSYLVFFLLMVLVSINGYSQQTYHVTNTTDGTSTNQFRGALVAADAAGGTSTITVDAGTYTLTTNSVTIGTKPANIYIVCPSGPASTIVTTSALDRIIFINQSGTITSVYLNVSGLQFANGTSNDPNGGGAISGGGPSNTIILTNCTFLNNKIPLNMGTGAAVNMFSAGDLVIDNCTFTNNISNDGDGGAVYYMLFSNMAGYAPFNGSLTVTNSTFTGNQVLNTSNGGAIAVSAQNPTNPPPQTFFVDIHQNTFINNHADGNGGAIFANGSFGAAGPINIHYNRFVGNSAGTTSTSGLASSGNIAGGVVNAINNWWGCNIDPSTANACQGAAVVGTPASALDVSKWLQLKTTASATQICTNSTSNISASFLTNSNGDAINTANLTRLIGLPISFVVTPAPSGSISGAQSAIQSSGTATATFNSNTNGGTVSVTAQVDNILPAQGAPAQVGIFVSKPVVANPATTTGIVNTAFSQSFTALGGVATYTFSTTSTLPANLTLSPTGVLSGNPVVVGNYPIVVHVQDNIGCNSNGATYNLTLVCQIIPVSNPATTTGTVGTSFSQAFTSSNTIGTVTYTLNSGTLPNGLALQTNGTLSGTPTQSGSFPITVKATDGNGCTGISSTYTLFISCQTITVTNPATTTGTNGIAFSQTFTQSGALGGSTFTLNSGSLPTGLTLSPSGVLSGTPSAPAATYPITVKATDGNGCTGIGSTYNLVISCQTITVTNPATTTGQVNVPFSQSFTQTGGVGTTTFSTASTLPNGITLSSAGVLSGTPSQSGTFPIVVTATDANGCTGSGPTYNLVINTCPVITVANPATTTGTAGTPFSQTFTSSGGAGTVTYSTASTLPTGLSLSTAGVLSGTPTQVGSFPIVVTATDVNSCTGSGPTYNLVINCPAPITATATPSSQTKCSGVPISTIVITSGGPAGIVYNWTRDNPVTVTGIAASGSGNISGTLVNTTSGPITVTFTITPAYYATCSGNPTTATVLVNPTPTVVATPSSQTICSGSTITTIALSGNAVPGVVYNWTRDNTISVTGIGASGSGNISGSLTNTTGSTVTVTFTVTPTANGCAGTPITATVQVNPTPTATATPSSQTICNGGSITSIVLNGSPVTGTVYNWTRDNTLAVSGIAASGSGNISGSLTNSTNAPVSVTFTITPTANSCPGTPITATVTVNPTPSASASPSSQTSCSGATINTIVLSGTVTGTVYNWSRNNTANATGIPSSGSGNISGSLTNTTNAPVTVTFSITPNFTNGGTSCGGATITATVTVNPLPTVTCPGTVTTTATPGQCGANVNYPVATATGTPTPTITYSKASGSFFPIGTTVVTVTASNSCGTVTCTFNVVVTGTTVTIPPVFAVNPGGIANTIYKTYGPQSLNLTAVPNGGSSPYGYSWSGPFTVGPTNNAAVNVMPPTPGTYTYTVVVNSSDGCISTASTAVKVYNISCGGNKISICQTSSTTNVCIGPAWVPAYLSNGYMLGACNTISSAGLGVEEDYPIENSGIVQGGQTSSRDIFEILVAPNPSNNEFGLIINSSAPEHINVRIMDAAGRILQIINNASKGSVIHVGNDLRSGTYFAEAIQGKNSKVVKLVKIN